MILRLHKLAKAEIREAADWYRGRGRYLDRQFLTAVRGALEAIEADPQRFAKLETLGTGTPFRRVLVGRFPYFIVYQVFEHEVFVYSVAHASRRPNYWRGRKRNGS